MCTPKGSLTPEEATKKVLQDGLHHLDQSLVLTFVKSIYGGILLSMGGLMSLILGTGFPSAGADNPALQRLLQGIAFPVGLILVYTVGAELYTGLPMYLTLSALSHKRPKTKSSYLLAPVTSWLGNLLGALTAAYVLSTATHTLRDEPFRSGILTQVHSDILSLDFHVIFLRAIGCGGLVTLAMFLGTQNPDGISKFASLHVPFMVACVARFPHTVEYMYLCSTGMMLGSEMSVWVYCWKCLLPITVGNAVGGMVTGTYLWFINLKMVGGKEDDSDEGSMDGGAYRD